MKAASLKTWPDYHLSSYNTSAINLLRCTAQLQLPSDVAIDFTAALKLRYEKAWPTTLPGIISTEGWKHKFIKVPQARRSKWFRLVQSTLQLSWWLHGTAKYRWNVCHWCNVLVRRCAKNFSPKRSVLDLHQCTPNMRQICHKVLLIHWKCSAKDWYHVLTDIVRTILIIASVYSLNID